jgi:hypothetical protein
MRGTLHLLPAAEFPLWLAALGGRRHYLRPSWGRYFGVTPAQLEQMLTAVGEALGGRFLTRDELAAEVGRRVGSPELGEKLRSSWGALLKPAAFRGQLCFAPSVGQNVRFTHPDTWLGGGPRRVDPDEARAEVTRRFVSAYGPVTHEHVARWWGVEPAPARALLEAVREELTAVEVEGRSGWMLAADVPEAAETAPEGSVRLLPAFDQYVVGAPRDASILPAALRSRVYRPQGWLSPVLLVDGRMAGVWRHELRGSRVVVQVEPFAPPAADGRAAAEAEAERLAIFLGGTLDLSWASPVR